MITTSAKLMKLLHQDPLFVTTSLVIYFIGYFTSYFLFKYPFILGLISINNGLKIFFNINITTSTQINKIIKILEYVGLLLSLGIFLIFLFKGVIAAALYEGERKMILIPMLLLGSLGITKPKTGFSKNIYLDTILDALIIISGISACIIAILIKIRKI